MKLKYLSIGALVLIGCATTEAQRAAREQERARMERCARVELYPSGVTPQRPFRVLGPVAANDDNPASRSRSLQEQACRIGADAVIDVVDETPTVQPLAGSSFQGGSSGGTAVAYTDAAAHE